MGDEDDLLIDDEFFDEFLHVDLELLHRISLP